MADATEFYRAYVRAAKTFIDALDGLEELHDRMVADPTLAAAAEAAAQKGGRTDLYEADFTNAGEATVQLMFTFDSGDPSNKSFLYKLL